MAYLAVTRFFDPSQETKYQARRYKNELIKHQLDRTQIANTCSKVITLAQIQIRDNDDAKERKESEEKKKKKRKKKSSDKYKIYQQRGSLKEHTDEQYDQFKLKKGDRVMCKAFKWWPRWYDGKIGEVTKADTNSTSVEDRYTVEFDDGEVCTMVDEYKIKKKQLNKFHALEYMLSLCDIIASVRWMSNLKILEF